ncbi:MAG: RNA-guided pseudouridylation complex pseudouridine synthase subunit Cbf5 [Candidatus Thermoplasmatota archaeon]|jgi:H/ACA ribonucleoprotein complex subunit 4|nr:RNA-guided pseudouridylation complex pseudouridine synthase subunit Cbf5 [Candidatus Thermoplasmatota archaeon]
MIDKKHELPSDKKRKRLIKIQVKTNPNYGKAPSERSVKELLEKGMINLDKPCGPTSHQVVAWVKDILGVDRVGHGGTLDPNATGVLPVGVGDGARVLQVVLLSGKEYVGIMTLHKNVDKKKLMDVTNGFVGEVSQVPPVRSAVKRVRRKRRIYYFDILEVKDRDVLFCVGCEAGTYVRTLCVDVGKKLGCGAHLSELRRTRAGGLFEKDSVILQDVKDAFVFWKEEQNEESIRSVVLPMERLLDHIPKIVIRDSAVDAICHGASLAVPGVVEVDSDILKGDLVAVLTLKGEGVALMNCLMSTEEIMKKDTGVCASPERVLMNKGTYPSIWKR